MFWSYIPPYNTSRVIMMHKFNEQHPEFPLLFVMPTSSDTMSAGVRFKGFVPHKIGATEIKEVIVHAPFAEWPLSTQVQGLDFRTGPKHQMEVRINGTRPMDLRLNELLSVTST
jgi:hypothetical protein